MLLPLPRSLCKTKTDRRSVFVLAALLGACAARSSPPAHVGSVPGEGFAAARPDDGSKRMPPRELGEVEATKRFCEAGPEAAVARGRALLARAVGSAADPLPNPTLSASHDRSLNAERDHETVVGIEVPLGIGGRRWLLQDAAAARQAQTELEAAHDRVMAAVSFRRAFVRASLASARVTLLRKRLGPYRSLLEKIDKLQTGGENAQLDRDRLQIEAELGAASAASQERELEAQTAWLEAVLEAPVELTDDPSRVAGAADLPDRRGPGSLRVAALGKAAEASKIEADAARRRSVPDVDLFAGYRNVGAEGAETGHGFSLAVSLPLTLFDHGQAEARRAEAEASLASAKAARAEQRSRAAERAARARLAAIDRAAPRLKEALALAEKTEQGTERLYLAGESSLSDVLQANRSRTELELALFELAAARADALLSIVEARGRFAEPELDAACAGGPR